MMAFFKNKLLTSVLKSQQKGVASIPELAVVLIILGLMVTSFATFSKIIGVAKANSVITSLNTIKEASFAFKNSYQFLPGDIINASSVISDTQQNGNGDGLISWGGGSGATTQNESLSFYQHLKAIGSISGINETQITSSTDASLTTNTIFRSNVDGAGFVVTSFKSNGGTLPNYGFDNALKPGSSYTIVFGMIGGTASLFTTANLAGPNGFTPSSGRNFTSGAVDAAVLASIDKKIDDANNQTGSFKYNQTDALPVAGFNVEM